VADNPVSLLLTFLVTANAGSGELCDSMVMSLYGERSSIRAMEAPFLVAHVSARPLVSGSDLRNLRLTAVYRVKAIVAHLAWTCRLPVIVGPTLSIP
jgi:hypothetical protein